MWQAQQNLKNEDVVKWELKNKRTGLLYWMTDEEMKDLERCGLRGRYIITELKPVDVIRDPFEIKKVTNTSKSERTGKKDSK